MPTFLRDWRTFGGCADDYGWQSWSTPTDHRSFSVGELHWLRLAEQHALAADTDFARYLAADAARLDEEPVPSGWRLMPLLFVLSADDAEPEAAAEVYLILRNGYDLVDRSTLEADIPQHQFDNYPAAVGNPEVIDAEVGRLHSKGYVDLWDAIRVEAGCPEMDRPHYLMPINLLRKLNPDGTEKDRVIFDPSRPDGESLNDMSDGELRTAYINIWMAMAAMAVGGSAWRADFEDSFHQLPLSRRSRRLAGFVWQGRVYAFRRGAFGFRPLPWVQQTVTIAIVRATTRLMQDAGLPCGVPPTYAHDYTYNRPRTHHEEHTATLPLLDDVGGFATSHRAATFGFLAYVWTCYFLGCRCSQKKGKTVPPSSEDMVFIGYLLKFTDMTVNMEADRITRMMDRLRVVLQNGYLDRHGLESIIGTLVFICTVVGMKTYYRSFIELLKSNHRNRHIELSDDVRRDISKWYRLLYLFNGRTVFRGLRRCRSRYPAYSDASFSGWGFAWAIIVVDGAWPQQWHGRFGRPTAAWKVAHGDDERIWINYCEALAALFCLRTILPWVGNGTRLTFFEDNQAVCGMLHKLQTASVASKPVVTEICWLLGAYNVELDVRYIESARNCTADAASRVRSAKITPAGYAAEIRAFCKGKPNTLKEAGLFRSRPVRPELIELMDVWPHDPEAGTDWFPAPIANR